MESILQNHQNKKKKKKKEKLEKNSLMEMSSMNQRRLVLPSQDHHDKSLQEVKLAAIAINLNMRLRAADMPFTMQERALCFTRSLLGSSPTKHRPSPTLLARALKKEFDSLYGPAWHCVVGKSFGSFVTHSPGGFVYFSTDDSLCFLLFKTEVHLVLEPPHG